MRLASSIAFVAALAVPATAWAHIELTYPAPRTLSLKQPNCGLTGSTRSVAPTVFAPGETITVTWTETVNHPGHYRISFDADGEDFTIPLDFDDTTQTENVLFDLIPDSGTQYTHDVTFPDIECETCTLQVIQMMTDKPPYGDGNDIYFQCADIALRVGGGPGPGPDAGPGGGGEGDDDPTTPPDATGSCSAGGGSSGLLLLFAALYWPMKKRRNRQVRAFQASSSCVAPGSQ